MDLQKIFRFEVYVSLVLGLFSSQSSKVKVKAGQENQSEKENDLPGVVLAKENTPVITVRISTRWLHKAVYTLM